MAEREVTGPAQRDVQMGGEHFGGSHHQKLVLFREDSSKLRVSARDLRDLREDQRVHEIAIDPHVGIERIEILWAPKRDGNVFIFMTKRRRAALSHRWFDGCRDDDAEIAEAFFETWWWLIDCWFGFLLCILVSLFEICFTNRPYKIIFQYRRIISKRDLHIYTEEKDTIAI